MLGGVQPPPKLLIERLTDGDVTCLRLSGIIDEQFDAPGLSQTISSRYVILDLGGVDRISSFGIRQWRELLETIGPRVAGIYYIECSPKVMDQFNMVGNFGGSGYIVSFMAPYRCDTCDQERRLLFRTDEETPLWRAGQAPPSMCPTCNSPEDFEEDPGQYFSYVAQQPVQQIPPPVMNFLRIHLNYGQGGQRKLRIEKRIEGRTTYLKLSGDLDSDLRAQKLADGLEGEVVIDLGGIYSIDPVGTAQWRKLMQMLNAKTGTDEQVDRINFLAVPAPFLERLGKPEDLTPKGQVLSLLVPYNCSRCRATTQKLVDYAMHGEELRAGRVPRIKCGLCGGPVTCVVSETWFSRLQTLQTPQISDELRKTLARLTAAPVTAPQSPRGTMSGPALSAAPVPTGPAWQQQPGTAPPATGPGMGMGMMTGAAPATGGPRIVTNPGLGTSSTGIPASGVRSPTSATPSLAGAALSRPPATGVLGKLQSIPGLMPALLVVILSLSGAVVYKILASPSGRAGDWKVVEAASPKTPPWHDLKFTTKSERTFIGRSPLLLDRADALERADVAAQTELATRLGEVLAAKFPEWRKAVVPLYSAKQQELREELDKAQRTAKNQADPAASEAQLAAVRERVADAQKRIAAVLRVSAGDALQLSPTQYWEKRARTNAKSGTREVAYQASSLIELSDSAFDKLVAFYSQSESAAKVRAVPYFPLLAWRYGPSVTGAIVVEIEGDSPLAAVGLKIGDIVVQVGGQAVTSAADLAALLPKAIEDSANKEVIIQVKRGEGGDDDVMPLKLVRSAKTPIRRPGGGGKKGR